MTRTRLAVLAASLGLVACQNIADPDKIEPTGPATAAALCTEITSALIDRVVQCLGVPLAWAQQGSDLPNCSKWDASIAAGRMAYDQFYGDACINLVRTSSCAQLFADSGGGGPPGACGQALQGLVPAGGVCATSEDCSSGTYCNYTGACGGTCKAYAALNQTCVDVAGMYTQCAPGLLCIGDVGSTTSTCLNPIPLAGACPAGYGCDDGLYCDRTAALPANWICRTRQTSGNCTQYDACLQPGYHCSGLNVSVTSPGDCRALAREGQSCKNGYGDCVSGTYCYTGSSTPAAGDSGSCTIFPGPPGACGQYGAETISCLGSYCGGAAAPACTAYIPLGNACSTTGPSDQCGPDNVCAGSPSVCAVVCP